MYDDLCAKLKVIYPLDIEVVDISGDGHKFYSRVMALKAWPEYVEIRKFVDGPTTVQWCLVFDFSNDEEIHWWANLIGDCKRIISVAKELFEERERRDLAGALDV